MKELAKAKNKLKKFGMDESFIVKQADVLLAQFNAGNHPGDALKQMRNNIRYWQRINVLDTNPLRDIRLDYFNLMVDYMERNLA